MPRPRGRPPTHKAVTEHFAGKRIWKIENLRAWDSKVEINIVKRDKTLSHTEAIELAMDLMSRLMENVSDDD